MKILTIRNPSSPLSTQGETFIDGLHHSWSLEPPDSFTTPSGQKGPIPCGVYSIKIVIPSPDFQKRFKPPITAVPEFQNVPNREGVYCHPLNTAKETESCVGVGFEKSQDFIGNSRAAFGDLLQKIQQAELHGESVEWTIREGSGAA